MSGVNQDAHTELLAETAKIARQFDINYDSLDAITGHFMEQMRDGLANPRSWQLPTYVTKIPDGTEKGVFLAVDLGGSNCRIYLVDLHGDSTFTVVQTEHSVPAAVMINSSYKPLFSFIAEKLADFLENQSIEISRSSHDRVRLGFTFSFACEQTSLVGGKLLHWDKGWDIPDAIGKDPCAMLQQAIDSLKLPVLVSVLANDCVGTLLTRSYTSGQKGSTIAGAIFGTGTNAGYVVNVSDIKRISHSGIKDGIMAINTEWGCFDDELQVLPSTSYDNTLDASSTNPGLQLFEKRVAGMYLGELLRLAIVDLATGGKFKMKIEARSRIFQKGGINTSFLSYLANLDEDCNRLDTARKEIAAMFSAENIPVSDVRCLQTLGAAITRRAARLAGASIAAIILQSNISENEIPESKMAKVMVQEVQSEIITGVPIGIYLQLLNIFTEFMSTFLNFVGLYNLKKMCRVSFFRPTSKKVLQKKLIDIGVEGSLIEFHPTFATDMYRALHKILGIGRAEDCRIQIGLAKNGSGVGAALMAQAAAREQERGR